MKTTIPLAFLLLTIPGVFLKDNPYCSIPTCPERSHTLCRFNESKIADICGLVTINGLRMHEIQELVQVHNILRKYPYLIFNEKEAYPESDSSDSDFIPLEWDDELARSARVWAKQCNSVVDECRNDFRFNVTQRVGVYDSYKVDNVEPQMYSVVFDWYRQDNEKSEASGSFATSNDNLNQHSQSVWGNATKLGCGGLRTEDKTKNYLYIACNYGPTEKISEIETY